MNGDENGKVEARCAKCFWLASEQTRCRLLRALKNGPMSVGRLTEFLGVKQPTVSYHLVLLRKGGIITMVKRGREHVYALDPDADCLAKCGALTGLISC